MMRLKILIFLFILLNGIINYTTNSYAQAPPGTIPFNISIGVEMNFEFKPAIALSGAIVWDKYWVQGDWLFFPGGIEKYVVSISQLNYKGKVEEKEKWEQGFLGPTCTTIREITLEWERIGIAFIDYEDKKHEKKSFSSMGILFYKGNEYKSGEFIYDIEDVKRSWNQFNEYGCIISLTSLRNFAKLSSCSYRLGWGLTGFNINK